VSRRDDGNLEIYVMNADGSGQRRLTRNTVRDSNTVWSPDGRRIAFVSNWQVWVMNADGSGQRRLTRSGARNFAPAWSPDGQRIAFERRLGRRQRPACSGCGEALTFEVWVMNADGSGQQRLTPPGREAWLVARRPQDRIRKQAQRPGRDLRHERRRQRAGNLTRTPGWQESWFVWSPAQK
jgi:Tol biopolymer transport system component